MLKRIIAGVLVCAMAATMMVGCGGTEKKPADGEKVSLTMWHSGAEDLEETSNHQRYLRAAERFMAANEGYEVTIVGSSTEQKTMVALSSGSGPDIVSAQWPMAGTWGKSGIIADLTDFVNNDKEFDKDDFIPSAWDRCTYKGRIYSIPTGFNSSELYYNIDFMEEKGAEVPETIGQLVKLAVDLTEYDDKGNIVRCGYVPDYPWLDNVLWPIAFGAEWINEETNEITFDSEEMKASYQWQIDIYNELGYDKLMTFKTSLGSGANEPFMSGKTAMQFGGEWMIDNIAKYAPDLNYGATYVPYPDGKPELAKSMFCTVGALMLNNETVNSKEDGWKLLSYVTGKETMGDFARGVNNTGSMMTRKSTLDIIKSMDTVPEIRKEVADMMLSPNVDGFPMSPYINDYLSIIADEMNKAFTDPANYTIDMAAKEVDRKVQELADASPINE